VVEPNPPGLNPRFGVGVIYLQLIILSMVDDVPVDSETLFDQLRESQDQDGSLSHVLIG
jgi:hypothetical protein